MRKIIASTYATLDGFIDNPHGWSLAYSNTESEAYAWEMIQGCDALLLGRVTYEAMAEAWPHMSGSPFADHVNAIAKYVVASQPVDTSAWGPTTVIPSDELVAQVKALKEEDGGDILIWGQGRLTDSLAHGDLLNEYRIWVFPVLKGSGKALFREESATSVEYGGTTPFSTGSVVHTYRLLP
ncbi:dihydrofolate reductase [Streptomyces sp. YC504]|uniref:Dihydrofolate reductase n=1 Tax=Streptomyces mesophilus TaxID=1775132 RepID=A0A6G4XKR6_9ACTN|nr:dihydrofolate reductase family protein [Streptomyces mesophilus]NGO77221.1 dihydrofolate reductase [Streptomyces mesophilus]